ncbi:putative tricarboxylic transport membrane protein [Thermanaeromonas toyohensis ToBE]|uniref:Putative tricarboxylic transport membrane protein n=1 Tax=Thermanaeromonas toyohensis ToBE TaxID=698762 RepID=A0A1W1W308_9FIRM|nr:tripartite tricarboxylate transporter TctB family protein [Thermanaeromonas toyohensis]SMB99976.1 putative tricarboxylic transport membrane protein [Thermanaeromonas toyohensis ToBE]
MRTQRIADIVGGLTLVALGAVALVASFSIHGVTGEHLHPRTLPLLLSWVILGAGALLSILSWATRGGDKPIDWPDRGGFKRILVTLVSIIFYLALLEPLGFSLSSFLFITFLTWYLGRYRWFISLGLGILTAVTISLVFVRFLELTFPTGPLGW